MIFVVVLLVFFIMSGIWAWLRVFRPLRQLSQQAELLGQGQFDALECPCGGIKEIDSIRRAMSGMAGHLQRVEGQSRHLTDGLENERQRIARELHDETVQSLIVASQGVDFARQFLPDDATQSNEILTTTRQQLVDTVTSLRNLIGDLRPPALDELGLVAALEMYIEKYPDLPVKWEIEGKPRRIQPDHELNLFRIAQEALSNAYRHSDATEIYVVLSYLADSVVLTIADNGKGFDLSQDSIAGHYGLLGIKERAQMIGAQSKIISSPAKGMTVRVTVPEGQTIQDDNLIRDPVCSVLIEPQQAYSNIHHEGKTYYFCCPVCQGAFLRNPQIYLQDS